VTLAGNEAKTADENSKAVAGKMTREQLLAAQDMARKCRLGDFKNCG
jgi:hypothetical protein